MENQELETFYQKDKIFYEVLKSILPEHLELENSTLFKTIIDCITNISPISVNILDNFYKEKEYYDPNNIENIKNVMKSQDNIFINNFYNTYFKYHKSYIIKNEIENILNFYIENNLIRKSDDLDIFSNFEQMFTSTKYLASKEFKINKGTKTALEFAFKNLWDAKVEGELRQPYYFEVSDFYTYQEIEEGACVNPINSSFVPDPNWNPLPPGEFIPPTGFPPQEDFCGDSSTCECTNPGRRVGKWIVSPIIGGYATSYNEFEYTIIGSMIPIFYYTLVKDLAHPVGFAFKYYKYQERHEFDDHFGLKIPILIDKLSVKSLCYNGDCSNQNEDVYYSYDGTGIIKSQLSQITSESVYDSEEILTTTKTYLFESGEFLKEIEINLEKTIEYYSNDYSDKICLIQNCEFQNYDGWSTGDRWIIDTTNEVIRLIDSGSDDILSQNFTFEGGKNYVLSINVLSIDGEIKVSFGDTYKLINQPGIYTIRYESDTTYSDDIIVEDNAIFLGLSTATIDSIGVYEDFPSKIYSSDSHSSVFVENLEYGNPINDIRDEFYLDIG